MSPRVDLAVRATADRPLPGVADAADVSVARSPIAGDTERFGAPTVDATGRLHVLRVREQLLPAVLPRRRRHAGWGSPRARRRGIRRLRPAGRVAAVPRGAAPVGPGRQAA